MIRAISIARRSGQTKSETINQQEHKLIYENLKILMLNPNREDLYAHINQRVDIMFEKGLVEEVKSLKNRFNLSVTAKEAIGYKEVLSYLDGELTLEECKELIKKRTRNYAKRQVTFFKNQFSLKMYQDVHELVLDNTKER